MLKFGDLRRFCLRCMVSFGMLLPYLWVASFLIIPMFILILMSLTKSTFGFPPYMPFAEINHGFLSIQLYFKNYLEIFSDSLYLATYLRSLFIAIFSTLVCLIISYPFAYLLINVKRVWREMLLVLVVIPFWTSFLIRMYGWVNLLSYQGVLSTFLINIGVINKPIQMMNNSWAVAIGMVHSYLPFMILPTYSSLMKIDRRLVEAAYDLGCNHASVFRRVVVPLSLGGAIAGSVFVFIASFGEFIIPEILGGSKSIAIGRLIWNEFFDNRNWGMTCAMTVVFLLSLVLPFLMFLLIRKYVRRNA